MKNILITGGAGFIGSNLSIYLNKKGYNVTVLDNLSSQIHGKKQGSFLYNSVKDITNFVLGDVRVKSDWKEALKGQDAIIHLAAETGTGQSMYEISKYNKVNILGTANLLDILANQKHSIKKILIASSRSIYGEGKYYCEKDGYVYPQERLESALEIGNFDPICNICNRKLEVYSTDENSHIFPSSIYAITKYQQEQMVLLISKALNISSISLRYQNVYGPGQALNNPYTGILSVFSTRLLNNHNIDIYEDGEQSRDFVYIDDVVKATTLALENTDTKNNIFNIGSGIATTVNSVANTLIRLYNSSQKTIISGKYRLGDIRHNYADLTKIKNILGYKPDFSFEKGSEKFVEWVNTQEIEHDDYDISLEKLRRKGFIK